MVEKKLDAQDTAEKGTDTQQWWVGTHEYLTARSRSLTLDHQQPWDIMHTGVETFPLWIGKLYTPQSQTTQGIRCLSTCSEDQKARQ